MAITVFESRQQVTRRDVIAFIRGRQGKAALRTALLPWSRVMNPGLAAGVPDLQAMADRYAEQVTANAQADLEKYFAMAQSKGYTLGGVPTGTTELPLTVRSRDPLPSATAIASLGEAVTGWYFEQQGLVSVSRPMTEMPDIVFRDSAQSTYYLVEVKSTQEPHIDSQIRAAMISLFDYVKFLLLLPNNPEYECCAVGVIIRPGLDYELRILRATVR